MKRHRILVVDDNEINLEILEKVLSDEYDTDLATNGEDALRIAEATRPDLILLDVMMPGIDGYEVCRRLRADKRLSLIRIIMVSARALVNERLLAYESGAHEYVTKPFEPDELLAKIRIHLELKSTQEVDSLKMDLLRLLSHETRTPLASILTPADLLAREPDLPREERIEFAHMIADGAERLLSLFNQVFKLCSLRTGSYQLDPNDICLSAVTDDCITRVAELAAERDIRIEGPESGCPAVLVDLLIYDVVQSLLVNAIRHTDARGTVRVATGTADDRVYLEVHNPGHPLDESLIDTIFEGLQSNNVDHHGGGTGLSLAIAREFCVHHRGTIEVASSADSGTTFRLEFPMATQLPPDSPDSQHERVSPCT